MVSLTSDTLFDAAAAVIGTVAALMFVLTLQYPYSPVSKFGVVAAFLAGVLYLGQRTADTRVTLLGYGVILVVGVAVFFDVANTFEAGTLLVVVGLLLLAGLLYALPRVDADATLLPASHARTLFAAVAVLAAVLLVVDVVTGGLAYELQPESEVEFTRGYDRGDPVVVATLAVSNPTPFPERVDAPRYEVCAVGDWSAHRRPTEPGEPRRPVSLDAYVDTGYNEYVFGGGARRYSVEVNAADAANVTGETFPVEATASCPDRTTGDPAVAVFPASNGQSGRYLVRASASLGADGDPRPPARAGR